MKTEHITTKQKIDQILGIDDFLSDLDKSSAEINDTLTNVSDQIKTNLEKIDQTLQNTDTNSAIGPQILIDLNSSMKEVEDLINTSKQMFKHIYESIISTDLLDSELISAAAKMLESIHINIAEFLNLYKDRQKFIDKIKIMTFQQQQKIEIMQLKHQQDLEKLKLKSEQSAIDIDANQHEFDQNQIIELLDEINTK